jgi:hypothetical protein
MSANLQNVLFVVKGDSDIAGKLIMVLSDVDTRWKELVELLAEEYPSQLEFAERIHRSSHSKAWFPSTSHGALVLSPTSNYEEQKQHPLISVNVSHDDPSRASLKVWTRFGDSNSLSQFVLPKEEAFERLTSFLESYACSRNISE